GAAVVYEGDRALGGIHPIFRVSHVEHGRLGRSVVGTDYVGGCGGGIADLLATDAGAVMCNRGFFFGWRLTPLLAPSRWLLGRALAFRPLLRLLCLRYGHLDSRRLLLRAAGLLRSLWACCLRGRQNPCYNQSGLYPHGRLFSFAVMK